MSTTILVVDDHDEFRSLLRELLGQAVDMNVVGETNDGPSAIRLAGELAPHVVLMDVVMPGMNGVEATRQIVISNPDIKVIALSMHAEARFVEAMTGAGASGYVLKDHAARELVTAIRAVAAGEPYVGSGLP
ncbi:MAG: response regulator transcription factor [Candidatus Krumholzibacteria bacterium]|nr:response regulator transcription factor [Candidatus Krumholzibacteria bacterium]